MYYLKFTSAVIFVFALTLGAYAADAPGTAPYHDFQQSEDEVQDDVQSDEEYDGAQDEEYEEYDDAAGTSAPAETAKPETADNAQENTKHNFCWNIFDSANPYSGFHLSLGIGSSYDLYQRKGDKYYTQENGSLVLHNVPSDKIIYEAESGWSIGGQYVVGLSFFNDLNWKSRNERFFGIGVLAQTDFLYSPTSSIGMLGVGINLHLLWLIDLSFGEGAAIFGKKTMNVTSYQDYGGQRVPVYGKKNNSGEYVFVQLGISFPLDKKYDIFLMMDVRQFDVNASRSEYAYWRMASIGIGIQFKAD
jgi:hypothetical protein